MSWTSGYVAEIDYTHGYYNELSPPHLSLALLLKNLSPIEPPFKYLELGFGQGFSLNVHAAAVPGEYWGTDFIPNHAANAVTLAKASGADVRIFDHSFAELAARDDLPEFDVIALHGIWSWISDDNRRVIVDIARRKLKVGGVFYNSYNTMPGWSSAMPLRHLLMMHADLASGEAQGIMPRIDAALEFGQQLVDAKARYFQANPNVSDRLKAMQGQNRRYLAHEYFNADWHPMSFADVARYLDNAKLSYAAPAHIVDNIDGLNLTAEQQKVVNGIAHPVLRETVFDYCINQHFRRDIWVKGRRELTPNQTVEALGNLRLVLLSHPDDIPLKVLGGIGEARLQDDIYKPIIAYLASDDYAPKIVSTLLSKVENNKPNLSELLTIVCGTGHATVAQSPEATELARSRTERLNDHIMAATARGATEINSLASPVTGQAVTVPQSHQLFLRSRRAGRLAPRNGPKMPGRVMKPSASGS